MPATRILAFSGSLRSNSWNAKLVRAALDGVRAAGAEATYIALRDYPLPIYDQEIEDSQGLPSNAT
jgi:NAD(P)H-dependent FMN reductase